MTDTLSIPDVPVIPDLSGIGDDIVEVAPFEDGWYKGTILEKRVFTDRNENERIFESSDSLSAKGDSRNIRLQIEVIRQSDGRKLNVSQLINYRPEDLTPATVAAVKAANEQVKEGVAEWQGNPLFRSFATLQRLQKLQKIAGKPFTAGENGGLDLTPVYGKEAYIRLRPDSRNPQYKEVADIRSIEQKPKSIL